MCARSIRRAWSARRCWCIFQNGWNRKDLVSETGARKKAFGVLADYYVKKARTAD